MSTKQLLLWHDHFEVYRDGLDEGGVWLALRGADFEATPSEMRVRIPIAVWELLRRAPAVDFDMLHTTDDQIAELAEAIVDERLQAHNAGDVSGKSRFAVLFGTLVFGSVEDNRDVQIARGIAHYKSQREQQRVTAAQIAEFESEASFAVPSKLSQILGDEARREADELHELAARILGSHESAVRWMSASTRALDGARPGDLLITAAGRERVRDHLARIERGIYT